MPLKARRKRQSSATASRPAAPTARHRRPARSSRSCPHCGDGAQTFRYLERLYKFDIDRAREIVLDGREAVELEPDDVRFSVDVCRIYEEHLDHVDTKYPGIIAHYWYPLPDGTVAHGHLLIDGHHRAARCLRDGLPYYVHILTEAESRAVTLRAPDVEAILAQVEKLPAKRAPRRVKKLSRTKA